MESNKDEVLFEFPPFLRVYKDGRQERILVTESLPPSIDPSTGVSSKNIEIDPETCLSARLYLPKVTEPEKKLPLVIYFHGGGFCIETASSPTYHPYLNSLVAQANVIAMSVDYRRAPEQPLPIAYEDSWRSLQWVSSQSQSKEEEWFKKYVDFDRVFMAGDSAGGNIAHQMGVRAGVSGLTGFKIEGIVLVHPYFCGEDPIGAEVGNSGMEMAGKLWKVVCPLTSGLDDPLCNPDKDPNLSKLGCKKVLVCVAELDGLRDRGRFYYDKLGKSGWDGVVEYMEAQGENHVFHLFSPTCENAIHMMKRLVSFFNASE